MKNKWDRIDGLDTAGFYLRGTDYAVLKPHKHAIQPSVTLAIRKMNQVISKYGFSRILLVTEDKKIYDQVKHYYGKSVNKAFLLTDISMIMQVLTSY